MTSGSILLHEVSCLLSDSTSLSTSYASPARRHEHISPDRKPALSYVYADDVNHPGHLYSSNYNKTVDLSGVALDQYQRSGLSSRHGAAILGPSPYAVARPSEIVAGSTSRGASTSLIHPATSAPSPGLPSTMAATQQHQHDLLPQPVPTEAQLRNAATQRGSVETAAAVHALISLAASNNDITELDIVCRRLRVNEMDDIESAIRLVEAHNLLIKKRCNKLYDEINRINDQQVALLSAMVESHHDMQRSAERQASVSDDRNDDIQQFPQAENPLSLDKAAAIPRSGPLTARRL